MAWCIVRNGQIIARFLLESERDLALYAFREAYPEDRFTPFYDEEPDRWR